MDFNGYNNYKIDDERIYAMMKNDLSEAVKISVWEKIKDFFRTDKKADAYKELYNLLHDSGEGDKLTIFNKLKSYACPEYQQYFTKEVYCNEVRFFLGQENVGQISLRKLMNVSEQTELHDMSVPEKSLFLKMIDTLRENESLYSDSYSGYIRLKMSNEHCDEILSLYRPQEDIDDPGTNLVNTEFLDYKEEKLLRYLSDRERTRLPSQFSSMGYQKTDSGIEFTMVHPSINYLLKSYSKSHQDGSSNIDSNSEQINTLNKVYHDYNYNKTEVDQILKKIYDTHNGTLSISFSGRNDNRIVNSPYTKQEYLFQSTHSLHDISDSLETIFNKWTKP